MKLDSDWSDGAYYFPFLLFHVKMHSILITIMRTNCINGT